jgi:hypothetical protein
MFGLRPVLHSASGLGCFHLSLRFGLLAALPSRLGLLDHWGLGCIWLGCGFGGVDKLGDAGLDRLIGRELGLGVEVELALAPVEGADHCVIARRPVSLRVEEVAKQEVERSRLAGPISERKRTRGPVGLSGLQQRSKGDFGERAV